MFSAAKLIEARKRKGWSQAELARAAAVSHTYIQNLERGEVRLPKQPYLDKLAQALGIEPDDLLATPPRKGNSVAEQPSPYEANPAIKDINVNLLHIGELDQSRVEQLAYIIQAVMHEAEREYQEEERKRRARRERK